jgi:hypothetical protein
MSLRHVSPPSVICPPTPDPARQQLHQRLDQIIDFCLRDPAPQSFLDFEKVLLDLLRSLGCLLIHLFLQACHERLEITTWTHARGDRVADDAAERTLKTSCGPVAYIRALLVPRHGGGPGVHPLDVELGLSRDACSPLVIGWFCRLGGLPPDTPELRLSVLLDQYRELGEEHLQGETRRKQATAALLISGFASSPRWRRSPARSSSTAVPCSGNGTLPG